MKKVKVIVLFSNNENCYTDFYYCIVTCTEDQYNNNVHHELAKKQAKEDVGFDDDEQWQNQMMATDEFDVAGALILDKFDWTKAPTVSGIQRQDF